MALTPEDFIDEEDLDESLEDKYHTVVDMIARLTNHFHGTSVEVDEDLFLIGLHCIHDGIQVIRKSFDDPDTH